MLKLNSIFRLSSTICTLALISCATVADDPMTKASAPFLSMKVESTKLANDIEVISGTGGNVLAINSPNGTLLVDDGITQKAPQLAKQLENDGYANVTTIIDTHYHFDHTGGNAYFAEHGAKRIIAQDNVKPRMATAQPNDFFKLTFPANPAQALPTENFASNYTLNHGGHELLLQHPAQPAHTDGDSFVYIKDANIIHMGDLGFNGLYPFIDYSVGGSIGGMVKAVDEVLKLADDNTKIIPGHGPVASKKDIVEYRYMLATVNWRISKMIKAGKTEDQVVAAKPTAEFDEKWSKGMFSGEQFTRIAYRSIKNMHKKASS